MIFFLKLCVIVKSMRHITATYTPVAQAGLSKIPGIFYLIISSPQSYAVRYTQ